MLLLIVVSMATFVIVHGQDQSVLPIDFESETMTYTNFKDNDVPWRNRQAGNATIGPRTDHTLCTGEGHYVYIEGSGFVYADLDSEDITITKPCCLSFWFYLNNDTVNYLDVFEIVDGTTLKTLFYYPFMSGLNHQWIHRYADLMPSQNSKIFFTGKIRDLQHPDRHHFVVLDDIEIFETTCQEQFGP